jgi:hypothetical protein
MSLVDRVPVRLVKENGDTIKLDATTIDIFVERVQSNFAIPLLQARKMGIDLNQAVVAFEIQGVFTNEEGQEAQIKSTGYIDFDQQQTLVGGGDTGGTGSVIPIGQGLDSWFNGLTEVTQGGGPISDIPTGLTHMHDRFIDLPVGFWIANANDVTTPVTTGLHLWLKSDALVLDHGDRVASWTDSSGQGNHAVQATITKQPRFFESGYNGKPVIRFDGADDVLQIPFDADLNSEEMTIFVVNDLNQDNGTYNTPISSRKSSPLGGYNFYFDMTAGKKEIEFWYSTGASFNAVKTGTGFAKVHQPYILTGHIMDTDGDGESDQVTLRVDGDQKDQDTGISFSPVVDTSVVNVGAGAVSGTSFELNGDVMEVLIYNRALSQDEIHKVEGYLSAKYNIRLPNSHPYNGVRYGNTSVRVVFDNDRKPSAQEPYGYVNRNRRTDMIVNSHSFTPGGDTITILGGNPLRWFEDSSKGLSIRFVDPVTGTQSDAYEVKSVTAGTIIIKASILGSFNNHEIWIDKNNHLSYASSQQSRPCFIVPVNHVPDYTNLGNHKDGSPIDGGVGNYTNAAEYLAYLLSKSLTTLDELGDREVDTLGNKSLFYIFETTIQKTNNDLNARVHITQKFPTEIGEIQGVINHNIHEAFLPLIKSFTGGQRGKQVKSSGDKVQDLMGILANSQNVHTSETSKWVGDVLYSGLTGIINRAVYCTQLTGDYIHAIQIPYNTLVTKGKSSKDGEIAQRNFFVTSGDVNTYDKMSVNNVTHASIKFRPASPGQAMCGIRGVVTDFIMHRDAEMQAYEFALKFLAADIIV